MSEDKPDYRVGYKQPPLHSRFKPGQSGNPEGARRHRRRDRRLVALIEEALDAPAPSRARRAPTRRQAVVSGLVEKAAAGDLRAVKLLLDLVVKTELAAPPTDQNEEDPREFLIRELDRLAAADEAAEEVAATEPKGAGDEPAPPG